MKKRRFFKGKYFYVICLLCLTVNYNAHSQKESGNVIKMQDTLDIIDTDKKIIEYKIAFSEGLRIKMLGDFNTAKEYFNRCLELDPDADAVMFELARIYFAQNEFSAAENYAFKAVNIKPDNLWYRIILASIYQKSGKTENAEKIYREIINEYPQRYDYYEVLINMYMEGNKPKQAIKLIEEIEKRIGLSEEISIQKEQIYVSIGDYKAAIKEINNLIKKSPENAGYYGILAEIYSEQGDKKNAIKTYNKILRIDPDNGLVHMSLYQFYKKNNEDKKAKEELFIAFGKPDINIEIKVEILLRLTASENSDQDLISLLTKEMKNVQPDEPQAFTFYADLLIKEGKNEEARILLRKILEEEPGKFFLWQQLLIIENDLLDFKSMYEESKKALEYFPDQPVFLLFMGTSANQLKLYKESVEALNSGVKYLGGNVELTKLFYISLGDVYNNLGKFKESDMNFDNLLALDPDNDVVLNNYSYYLSVRKTNLDKAEQMIIRCMELVKNNATYMDTYAWVLFQKEKYKEAEKIMRKVMNSEQDISGEMFEHYGDILYKLGKKDEALIQWKKASETDEGSEMLKEKILNQIK